MRRTVHTMLRPAIAIWAGLLTAVWWPADAQGQQAQSGAVRGVVRSTLGDRIPYAVVVLEPGYPRRFTDDSGTFAFANLHSGTYQLRARQVGYKPLDTTVVVTGAGTVEVTLALEHLVIQLDEIRVVERAGRFGRCTAPGPPDPATLPEFADVFGQLRQNAERYWMLADSYPAIYGMERRHGRPDHYNHTLIVSSIDTVELRTDARWNYAPGRVVTEVPAPRGGTEMQVNLPGLPDFADTTFLMNHCFRLAGMDRMEGRSYLRLDFRAAERIRYPDADGSAYLDPNSLLIRYVTMRLTHPYEAAIGLESVEATVAFREVVPSLVLPDSISSLEVYRIRLTVVERVEEQRAVGFHFLRALPTRRP